MDETFRNDTMLSPDTIDYSYKYENTQSDDIFSIICILIVIGIFASSFLLH